jgi:dolichyldiphosphatase
MDNPAPLASLSLTHVHYDPTDPLSYLSAWLALVPQGLCIMYVTLIWSSREVEILMMFAGQMICEALNFALKRLIREERPKRKSHLPQVVLGRVVDGATAIC